MRECAGVKIGRLGFYALVALLSSPTVHAASLFTAFKGREAKPAGPSIEEDLASLISQARHDLSRAILRERADHTFLAPPPSAPAATSNVLSTLVMPVVGHSPEKLYDSWGDPRDGGRRRHRGIDIFAPRGTQVVAVTDGYIGYIGNWGKGGRSLWLTTEDGVSFYYAHLDRWASGIYEGMSVRKGDIIGYVGNTGNAVTTPPHLHFAVLQNEEAVNPYPVLRRAPRSTGRPILSGGLGSGTQ
jgi:murein DD-endopeptidase MepM/ murein hydrolase activator NlpD